MFTQAQRMRYGRQFVDCPRSIEDDHVPFVRLGVPAVDIIDFDYTPFNLYWHSRFDTPDKCSPASLGVIGRIILKTLQALAGIERSRASTRFPSTREFRLPLLRD